MTDTSRYVGSELDLFAAAENWKRYVAGQVRPWLRGDVLEVGAGIGTTARAYWPGAAPAVRRWVALEPDRSLADRIVTTLADRALVPEVVVGTLADLPPDERFDALLYIDVLEHIPDDGAELARAAERLRPGGVVIVLSPAHQWLFSPFDEAVGHCRRYTLASVAAAAPETLRPVRLRYLDAAGLLASSANRFLLSQSQPTERQIAFWDGVLVQLSRVVDPVLGYRQERAGGVGARVGHRAAWRVDCDA